MSDISIEAEGELLDLVSRVEQGNEVVLTRHGRPVARLVASEEVSASEDVMTRIRHRREEIAAHLRATGQPPITVEEIIGWVREGRR